jgi:hypothetical protein
MQRRGEFDGDVVAPDARVDVEAPVAKTTDADAQSSQYKLDDYGNNAGDNVADPDLGTKSQIWAPGESPTKSSSRMADAATAVRYAEAHINAGLPCDDKWKFVSAAQTLRHAVVVDRIRTLEAVVSANQARARSARKVTAASSRGTGNGIPRGLTSPVRTAGRSDNDPTNDVALWI